MQVAVVDAEDETADLGVKDEGTRLQREDGASYILINVLVRAEPKGGTRSIVRFEFTLEDLFIKALESTPGVVDHHHRARSKEPLTEQQGTNRVIARDAAGVSNEVYLTEIEPERAEEVEARIHTREHGEVQLGFSGQFTMTVARHVGSIIR